MILFLFNCSVWDNPPACFRLQPKVIGGKPSAKTPQDESDTDSSEDEDSDTEDDQKPTGKQTVKSIGIF